MSTTFEFTSFPRCPRCASDSVYVECLEPSAVHSELDQCRCRCGKCAALFDVQTSRDAWFASPVYASPSIAPQIRAHGQSLAGAGGHEARDLVRSGGSE